MADIARLALQIDVTGAQRARQALAGLQDGSIKATRATDRLAASTTRLSNVSRGAGSNFRFMRGSVQQVGFQIGDFATQVSSGQNAIVAFGQQASQLAGIMGPGGALLGAVIAIGSGIAGAFARSMMTGTEATGDMVEKTKELVEELGKATDRQREFINTNFQQEILKQKEAVSAAEQTIYDINRRMQSFTRTMGEQELAFFETSRQYKDWKKELDDARLVIDNAESATAAVTKRQNEFWESVKKGGKDTEDTTDKLEEMVESLQAQAETVGMSARETAIYEANRLGANQADRDAINNAFDQIEAEKQRQEQLKQTKQQEQALQKLRSELDPAGAEFNRYADQVDAIEQFNISAAEKERLREEAFRQHQENMVQIAQQGSNGVIEQSNAWADKMAQNQQYISGQVAETLGNTLGALKGFTEQGSAEWAALVVAQRGIMAAQAIMAANLAASMALTAQIPGDPSSPARAIAQAEIIRNLGYVNAGLILAQGVAEIAGARAMGGQVQAGSSYLVGERGPEVVTMGGTGYVTPNHRLGGESDSSKMIVNVNNAPQGTRVEQRTDNQGNQIADVFIADVANGGPMSKTMQSTFGLRRQGR